MDSPLVIKPPLAFFGGYVCLPLNLSLPAKQITFRDHVFYLKEELHCSLVCIKCILVELSDKPDQEGSLLEQQILGEIEAVRQHTEPEFIGFKDELRHVTRNDNQSIIVMVNIAKLEPIFEHLRSKYSLDIPSQPTHVTLYSTIPNRGIGIQSPQVLESITEPIQGDELKRLKIDIDFKKLFKNFN
jgi:hypothetical protein